MAISVSLSQELLGDIDKRAESLGLNRSQYLAQLARRDVAEKGHMILTDTSNPVNSAKVDAAVEAAVSYISRKARRNRKP